MVLGFALGAALFGVLVAAGNPDWRSHLTVEDVVRSVTFYGLCGVGVAAVSIVGGWISVAIIDRRIHKSPGTRVGAAAVGAASGTFVLGVGFTGVTSMLEGSGSWAFVLMAIAVGLALLSGIAAAVLVAVREKLLPMKMSGEWQPRSR